VATIVWERSNLAARFNHRHLHFDHLEQRLALAANVTAQIVGGDLIIQGDQAPNRVRVDVQRLRAGEVRVVASPEGTVNGQFAAAILRGWQGDVRINLGGGNDRIALEQLPIQGNLRVEGGPGSDTIVLDRSEVAGSTLMLSQIGHDSLHLAGSHFVGGVRLETADGRDVVALSQSSFEGPVLVRTGAGDDTILLDSSFAGNVSIQPGPGQNSVLREAISASFDFRRGAQGWQAGFADYPAGEEEFFELESGIRPLPPELAAEGTGFFIQGNNHSDDLFMFLKRRLTRGHGIVANQTYQVRLKIVFASNAPSGAVGIGGAPGESVFLKAGAGPAEPRGIATNGYVQMNVDKGDQASRGQAASIVGDIANGREASNAADRYVSLARTHVHEFAATANSAGELWLLIGTDSGFEGTTALYYQRIEVELIPIQSAEPPPPLVDPARQAGPRQPIRVEVPLGKRDVLSAHPTEPPPPIINRATMIEDDMTNVDAVIESADWWASAGSTPLKGHRNR